MQEQIHHTLEMEWQEADQYPPGAKVKVLRQGDESGAGWTILLKLPPHWHMNPHTHTTTEEHYVLEGEYENEGCRFPAGSYQLIPKGTHHGALTTETGAIILITWDLVGR